jgi:hypothetical protein
MHLPKAVNSKPIFIGSEALRVQCSAINIPTQDVPITPFDYDLIGDYDTCINFIRGYGRPNMLTYPAPNKMMARIGDMRIEAEISWGDDKHTTSELVQLIYEDPLTLRLWSGIYASVDVLYLLKMSHRYLKDSPHFLKTMEDIHFMRKLGAKIRPEHEEFYKKRIKETYWYEHPNLDRSKEEFFSDDGVPYVYYHDDIHKAVALFDQPAYEYYRIPGKEVLCSKELFFKQPEDIRLAGVIEETYVLALERSQIPSGFTEDPDVSFSIALEKVCTSITSGWFREYAWENYYKIKDLYTPDYVQWCKLAIPTMRKYDG